MYEDERETGDHWLKFLIIHITDRWPVWIHDQPTLYNQGSERQRIKYFFKMSTAQKITGKSTPSAWAASHHGSCAAGLLIRKHSVGLAEDKCYCRRQRRKANIIQAGTTLACWRNRLIFLNLLLDWAARSNAARLVSLWEKHPFFFLLLSSMRFFWLKKRKPVFFLCLAVMLGFTSCLASQQICVASWENPYGELFNIYKIYKLSPLLRWKMFNFFMRFNHKSLHFKSERA